MALITSRFFDLFERAALSRARRQKHQVSSDFYLKNEHQLPVSGEATAVALAKIDESKSGALSNDGTVVHVSIVVSDVRRREKEGERERERWGKTFSRGELFASRIKFPETLTRHN